MGNFGALFTAVLWGARSAASLATGKISAFKVTWLLIALQLTIEAIELHGDPRQTFLSYLGHGVEVLRLSFSAVDAH